MRGHARGLRRARSLSSDIAASGARIPADRAVLSGWTVKAVGRQRDGMMIKGDKTRETRGKLVGWACFPTTATCHGKRNDLESDNAPVPNTAKQVLWLDGGQKHRLPGADGRRSLTSRQSDRPRSGARIANGRASTMRLGPLHSRRRDIRVMRPVAATLAAFGLLAAGCVHEQVAWPPTRQDIRRINAGADAHGGWLRAEYVEPLATYQGVYVKDPWRSRPSTSIASRFKRAMGRCSRSRSRR